MNDRDTQTKPGLVTDVAGLLEHAGSPLGHTEWRKIRKSASTG